MHDVVLSSIAARTLTSCANALLSRRCGRASSYLLPSDVWSTAKSAQSHRSVHESVSEARCRTGSQMG